MGRFAIEFSKNAAKDYQRLPQDYKALVDASLSRLANGVPTDVKPIAGEKDIYRILLRKIEKTLLIAKIGPRGDFYK